MTAAAFQATYSDWRIIKGRKVVQVVFELPLEKADEAYKALGGMPIAANEVWCGIARMKQEVRSEPPRQEQKTPPTSAGAEKTKRKFDDMSPAQQAGMFCADEAFRLFLREKHSPALDEALHVLGYAEPEILASKAVCDLVGVERKRDIRPDNAEWTSLILAYRLWQREPEVVPA